MNQTPLRRLLMRLGLVVIVCAGGVMLVLRSGIDWSQWTPQAVRSYILAWGWWAPVAYIAAYTLRVFVLFPASLMTLTGGVLFGPWWGTFYTVIGATICGAIEFGVARWVGREAIERWLAGHVRLAQFDARIARGGFLTVLLLRLIPSVPYEVMNISLGLSPVRWRHFLPATALGIMPWSIAFGFMGEALTDFRAFGKVLLGILALVLVIWGPWLWRHRRRRLP